MVSLSETARVVWFGLAGKQVPLVSSWLLLSQLFALLLVAVVLVVAVAHTAVAPGSASVRTCDN